MKEERMAVLNGKGTIITGVTDKEYWFIRQIIQLGYSLETAGNLLNKLRAEGGKDEKRNI